MKRAPACVAALFLICSATGGPLACASQALELPPPICLEAKYAAAAQSDADEVRSRSFPELRQLAAARVETDPDAAIGLMCAAIARAAREQGGSSLELAWWVGSLATPMIAYMERFAEAIPLLEFAQPIYERELGPDADELAEIHVAYAWIANRQGRQQDSVAAWKRALAIRERNPGARKIELQKVLVGLALGQASLREFGDAKAALARAHAILVENGETVSEAAAAIESTYINIAWREEDYVAARDHAATQVRIEETMGGPAAQRVPAWIWLGRSLERLDEFDEAEAALRKAVEISESRDGAPLQRHHFVALTQLAGLLVVRGKPIEAASFAGRAVEAGEATRGPDAPQLVRPLEYLGDAQRDLGDLPAALRSYERAGALIDRSPEDVERPWRTAYHRGLAQLQLQLGDREGAQTSLSAALAAAGDDPTLTIERASTLLEFGTLVEPAQGREALDEALALFRLRLPETHPAILRVLIERCALELRARNANAPQCEDARQRIERSPEADPFLRHDAYAIASARSEELGEAALAYEHAIRALSAATTLGTPDPLWKADFAMARLVRARDADPALAIFLGKESIAQIERQRARFGSEERRLEHGFLRDKIDVYRAVADWLMEAGRIDEGLDVARLLKAEELYDFSFRDATWNRRGAGIELTSAELALRERYHSLLATDEAAGSEIDRLGRLQETGRITPAERQQLDALLAGEVRREQARAARIREFLDSAQGSSAPRGAVREVQAAQLAKELKSLGPDAALAFYLLTDTRLRVLIATRLGQFEYETAIDAPALRRDIGRYLEQIGQRGEIEAGGRSLYAAIAKPLDDEARRAGAKKLVLWLDGALRYVPFAALPDGRGFLVDRYSIESYVPGDARGGPAAGSVPRVRGFGVTRAIGGFEALPAMADELCDIVKGPVEGLAPNRRECVGALPGEGYANQSFTESRLRDSLVDTPAFSILHLGTHFSLRPGNARRSFLVMGDGSRLTLDAIGALDFSGLQLVTLSACQSGLGGAKGDDGREIEGLSAIVQQRGASHVIASLWKVEDRSTASLMRELYASLPATDAAEALRRSQLRLRGTKVGNERPWAHPYYWAGFRVSASPTP